MPNLNINVLYFAKARELAKTRQEVIAVPQGATIQQVFELAHAKHPELIQLGNCTLALNCEYVQRSKEGVFENAKPLSNGDELAFIPPVSGG